jgi:hypothetical protein
LDGRIYLNVLSFLSGRPLAWNLADDPELSADMVRWLLRCWRILPSLDRPAVDELTTVVHPDQVDRLVNCWLATSAFARTQAYAARQIVAALEESNIPYSLLKGAATGLRLYGDFSARGSSDIDLGVARRHLRAAERVATEVGFRPAQKNDETNRFEAADPAFRARVEAEHYELGFLVRRLHVTNLSAQTTAAIDAEPWCRRLWPGGPNEPWCYALVDIHHSLSLDIPIEDVLTSAHRIQAAGSAAFVPSDHWLAAHLIFKIYWEGVQRYGKGVHQYADLARLVPQLTQEAFDELVNVLNRLNLVAAGHYVLRRLPLLGVASPEWVQGYVRSSFAPAAPEAESGDDPFPPPVNVVAADLNDLGDMWARLWGQR